VAIPLAAGDRCFERAYCCVRRRPGGVDTSAIDHASARLQCADCRAVDATDVHARTVHVPGPVCQPLNRPDEDSGGDPDRAADAKADPSADAQANPEANTHANARTAVAQPARHARVAHGT
jgi:hypothetical protein